MRLLSSLLFIVALLFSPSDEWGIADWVEDSWNTVTDADTWNALATAISEAAEDTKEFFEELSSSSDVEEITAAIRSIVTLSIDAIEEVVDGFNVTSWQKMAKGAKGAIHNFGSELQEKIAIGMDFVSTVRG